MNIKYFYNTLKRHPNAAEIHMQECMKITNYIFHSIRYIRPYPDEVISIKETQDKLLAKVFRII